MTLVIYKNFRVEIEYEQNVANWIIYSPTGMVVFEDKIEIKQKELVKNCHKTIDEYLKYAKNF